MNTFITIPETWNPQHKNGFDKWINKVLLTVEKSKLK